MKEYKNAQAFVLSACLLSEVAVTKVIDKLTIDNFSESELRNIFTAISSLFDKNSNVNILNLSLEMKALKLDFNEGWLYTKFVDAVNSDITIDDDIKIVLDHTSKKKVTRLTANINNKIALNEPIDDVLDYAREGFMNINKEESKNMFNSQEAVIDTINKTQEIHVNKIQSGLRTNIYGLNKMVLFKKQNVVVIAAKKSVGKSALVSQIAFFNASQGKKGAMILLEGTINDLTNREISRMASIEYSDITMGRMNPIQFKKYQKASEAFAKYPILYSTKRGLTFPQIKSKLIMMRNKLGELDFIVIDYIQKIRTPKGHSRQRELADVSEELGVLAQDFDCPVFALSQVNHDGITREAEDLENDADVVLKLRREVFEHKSKFVKTTKFPKLNKMDMPEDYSVIQITKNKNGKTGGVELRSMLQFQRFEDWNK